MRTSSSRQKHEGERFGKGGSCTVFEYSTERVDVDGVKVSNESGRDRDGGHEEGDPDFSEQHDYIDSGS